MSAISAPRLRGPLRLPTLAEDRVTREDEVQQPEVGDPARALASALVAAWRTDIEAVSKTASAVGEDARIVQLLEKVLQPLAKAEPPFDDLRRQDDPPLGNRFLEGSRDRSNGRPAPALTAAVRRDAFMRFAAIRGLLAPNVGKTLQEAPNKRFSGLVAQILASVDDERMPTVLRPASGQSKRRQGYQPVDYAGGPNAADFFNRVLAPLVPDIMKAGVPGNSATSIPVSSAPYDPRDTWSIARWSRIWTVCVALIALDWIRQKATSDSSETPSATRLALALWRGISPQFRAQWTVLPTDLRTLHLELDLDVLMAQVLSYDPAHWSTERQRATVRVRMHALEHESSGGKTFYRGRRVAHLYLAVLAQVLCDRAGVTHDVSPIDTRAMPLPEFGNAAPSDDTAALASPQRRIVRRLSDAESSRARKPTRPPTRFAPVPVEPALQAAPSDAGSDVGPLAHVSIGFLPAAFVDGDEWSTLGTIELWPSLHRTPLWLDFACVVYLGGRTEVAPIMLDDPVGESPEADERSELVLNAAATAINAADLARALADPARARWGYEYAGLGVFVVVLVDLDAGSA